MEVSQEALQARVDATANEVRAFARAYASAVEAHCLSLLHRLEELRIQRRSGTINAVGVGITTLYTWSPLFKSNWTIGCSAVPWPGVYYSLVISFTSLR